MNKLLYALLGILVAMPSMAANDKRSTVNNNNSRASVVGHASVGVAQQAQSRRSSVKFEQPQLESPVDADVTPTPTPDPEPIDDRDAERSACLANNIGVDATFVWASRFSNTGNYATMVEDTENPENNVCFALVKLNSNDKGINISDFPSKYFPVDETVTCGSWVESEKLEQRILDAKKTTRTLATIGGAVGGAGIGVGAMELFGNKALDSAGLHAVQGQKATNVDDNNVFISKLKEFKDAKEGSYEHTTYENVKSMLEQMEELCKEQSDDADCKSIPYEKILNALKTDSSAK